MLDVQRGDHVDARVEQLLDVLPALLVARSGGVGVRELVDEHDVRAAGRGRHRRPSPTASCRGTRSSCERRRPGSPSCSGGLRPTVGLDDADHDVGAALGAPSALVEHRVGLADARRGAEVDAQRAAGAHRSVLRSLSPASRVERQIELDDVHAGSPSTPSTAPVGVLVDHRVDRGRRRGPAPGRRARPGAGRWRREMCGSSPDPEAVTASTGTSASAARPFSCAVGGDPLGHGGQEVGVGRSEVRAGAGRAVVPVAPAADGRGWKYCGAGEVLADQLAADDLTVACRSGCR